MRKEKKTKPIDFGVKRSRFKVSSYKKQNYFQSATFVLHHRTKYCGQLVLGVWKKPIGMVVKKLKIKVSLTEGRKIVSETNFIS